MITDIVRQKTWRPPKPPPSQFTSMKGWSEAKDGSWSRTYPRDDVNLVAVTWLTEETPDPLRPWFWMVTLNNEELDRGFELSEHSAKRMSARSMGRISGTVLR